jgi:superfamily II DNA or RNA helicase
MLVLRDYQQDLVCGVYDLFEQGKRIVMAQSPTGSGKSKIFSKLAIDARAEFKKRVLILAHTKKLVRQNAGHLEQYLPGQVGIIMAKFPKNYYSPVQSGSVQTVINRLDDIGEFDVIIADECQHTTSKSYRTIFARFPNAQIIGLTATPIRTDGSGFDDIYEALVTGIQTAELIERKHLSRYIIPAMKFEMITSEKRSKGDFDLKDLAELNDVVRLAGDLVESYKEHANGGSCIVFAIDIEYSKKFAAAYNAAGIPAIHVDATSEDDVIELALSRLESGDLKVICNYGLFGEGVDIPSLACVQCARPTQSKGLWLQICGRVLRVFEGKEYGVILDHTDNHHRLGLPCDFQEWTLEGKPKKEKVSTEVKEKKAAAIERKRIVQVLSELKLVKIATRADGEKYWDDLLTRKIQFQQKKGSKKSTIFYTVGGQLPPQRIWIEIARYIGKTEEWGIKSHKEQEQRLAREALQATSRAADGLRAIEAVRSRWDRETLQAASRLIASEQRDKIKELVEADNARKETIAA